MEKTNIITEILETFKIFDGNYKREQVDAAIELKEEITPHLIEILENVRADPDPYIQNENLFDHIYALMLLGHFRESKAHNVIKETKTGKSFEEEKPPLSTTIGSESN